VNQTPSSAGQAAGNQPTKHAPLHALSLGKDVVAGGMQPGSAHTATKHALNLPRGMGQWTRPESSV